MRDQTPDRDTVDLLHEIVDEMLKPFGKTSQRDNRLVPNPRPPFDVSRPNEHNTKAEFLCEKEAVQASFHHVAGLMENLTNKNKGENHEAMLSRLRPVIDQKLRGIAPKTGLNDGFELIRKNVADLGGFTASAYWIFGLFSLRGYTN